MLLPPMPTPSASVKARDLFDRTHPESVFHVLDALEHRLGLTHGFCERLINEDSWSFLIKLSALLETAITEAVVRTLGRPEIEEPFSHVPLGDAAGGKAAFAVRLGLLHRDEQKAIQNISRTRNHCAHRVREVSFDLKRYLETPKLRDAFLSDLANYWTTGFPPKQRREPHTAALENPKAVLWRTGLLIVALLAVQVEGAELRTRIEAARNELLPLAAKLAAYILLAEPGTFTLRAGGADLRDLILPVPNMKSGEAT
jgi:hypothetical protein